MSRGNNHGTSVAATSTSPSSGVSSRPTGANQLVNSSGVNTRSSRLSNNTVHLGFFVVPKAVKRSGDPERDSSPIPLNTKPNQPTTENRKTNDSMKSSNASSSKSNGRHSSRSATSQQQQQSSSNTNLQRASNVNDKSPTLANANNSAPNTSTGNSNLEGATRREGKEDYWYYDSVSDGFYYELNGSRGWRKRNPRQHASFIAAQQQVRANVHTTTTVTATAALSNSNINSITNSVAPSIQQQHQHLESKLLIGVETDKPEQKNAFLANKFGAANNISGVPNYKYDEQSDGFFYEKASVDGWRRRQPVNNGIGIQQQHQQILNIAAQSQPNRTVSQQQFPQPQSRVVRQLHNQYQERVSPQNIFEMFGRPYSEFLTQKIPPPPIQRSRQMSNAELEDIIVSRSSQLRSIDDSLCKQFGQFGLVDGVSSKCCCGRASTDNATVIKSASSTTINSSLSSDSPPPQPTSKFLTQIMSTNMNAKTPWALNPLEGETSLANRKVSSNIRDFSFLPPSSSLRQNSTHQRQRSSQTGSFEEHYEFYADCTDSDKASLGNAPSISSIDDLQHTLSWNGFQRGVRRQQQQDDGLNAFLSNNENQKLPQSKLYEGSILARTLKRPDSLSVSQNVVDWGTSVQKQQRSTPVGVDHLIDNIPTFNDQTKYLFGFRSPTDNNRGCFENVGGNGIDFVSNSPLVTPMALNENLLKDRLWDNSANLSFIDLMNNGVNAPYSLCDGLDADAVLEQNVRDVAKLWQCTA